MDEPQPELNNQPVIPQEPVPAPIPPKHFGPKFFIAIVAILVVAGAACGGIWWWANHPLVSPHPVASPTLDPTADWKTYTNTEYGFEFKYPNDLYTEENEYAFRLKSSPRELYEIYDGGGARPEGVEGKDWVRGYTISVRKKDVNNISLISEDEDYQVIKLNYSNIEAYEIRADVPGTPPVYIKNPHIPNSFIEMGYGNGLENSNEAEKVFDQILSTFKFTK